MWRYAPCKNISYICVDTPHGSIYMLKEELNKPNFICLSKLLLLISGDKRIKNHNDVYSLKGSYTYKEPLMLSRLPSKFVLKTIDQWMKIHLSWGG